MKSTTTTGIIRSFPSFDYFLEKAKHRISHFPQKHQKELIKISVVKSIYTGVCGDL